MEKSKLKVPLINLILFLATVYTTFSVGCRFSVPLVSIGMIKEVWQGAMLFSLSLLGILGCHEMGHKFIAERMSVKVSLPYFIPIRGLLGTLGAFVMMRKRPPHRNALFDISGAGPIAGFLVAVPILILGLKWSILVPTTLVSQGAAFPTSLLVTIIQKLMGIDVPEGYTILLHPMALTGQIGTIITMLNLMPVGFLDGGHISRALFGPQWQIVVSLVAAGLTFFLGYELMAILMMFFAMIPYEGPVDDITPLSRGRKVASIALLMIFITLAVPT